ncbi:putative ferric-chelate reductase 1-like protein, partial [Stegodyphus mimosarum]
MKIELFALTLLFCILSCRGRPDGAPKSSCSTLLPVHRGNTPQRSSSPYTITAERSGNKIRVIISSPSGEPFQGFILQARSAKDRQKTIDGKFTQQNDISKAIDCFRGSQNTLTHSNTNGKREIITEWSPADEVDEDIIFRATVSESFSVFWTEIDSSPIRMGNNAGSSSKRKKEDSHTMYDNCFVSKGCLGYPPGCVNRGDCEVLLSYANDVDGIAFKMYGFLEPQTYMAMGLSTDSRMGDDAVTECFRQGSSVIARESWNNGKSNAANRELPREKYNAEFTNGLTSCSWTAKYIQESYGRRFDLANSTYYLLLAKGPMKNGKLSYHSGRLSTQEPVNFTGFDVVEGGVDASIKIHGTFMITAWVGFVSVGILLARHFKSAFENRTLCGVKIWFALHRSFMIVALIFVVIAFIVIFVYKGGWNYETRNPHAVLGCIATALGLFQPIMAAFRPAPDHPKRPIFNWLHWAVGNLAHIIAVITIFFAVSLESSGLKESFYWVMSVVVIVYVVFHLLFHVHAWTSGKKKNSEVKMLEMNAGRGNNNMQNNPQEKNSS